MFPQRIMLRSLLQPRHGRQRTRMRRAQQIAALRQRKPTRRVLAQKADCGLRAQQAIEERCIQAHVSRKLPCRSRYRPVQPVENAQLGAGGQDLAAPTAENKIDHLPSGGCHRFPSPLSFRWRDVMRSTRTAGYLLLETKNEV